MTSLFSATRRVTATSLLAMGLALLSVGTAKAGTIGYWRFEGAAVDTAGDNNDWLDDYSGNGLKLGISTATPAPSYTTLPASGAGSAFGDPIPQSGSANSGAALYHTTESDDESGGNLYVLDSSLPVVSDFTVEAYVNKQLDTSRTQYIISHWRNDSSKPNQRSWTLGVAGSSDAGGVSGSAYDLFLLLSDNGSDTNLIDSGIDLQVGVDYYVAASFDESEQTGGVTFYVQDLTNGGALQTVTADHPINTLFDSTAALRFGTYSASDNGWGDGGLIDEVRYSSGVLSPGELLIATAAVPEPGALVLLVSGGLMVVCRRRRKSRRSGTT